MKVLMYCQHVLGIGHMVRSTEVARAVAREADVTFISGGAPVDGFPFPPSVTLVQLPAIQTDQEFGSLDSCESSHTLEELQGLRREQILDLFARIRPDVLVIELFPFGRKRFAFELIPLLERARKPDAGTLVVCSLRDILVEKSDQARHEERVCRIVNTYFHMILVHGDPAFQKLDGTFRRVDDLQCEIRYTGFVQQEQPVLTNQWPSSEPSIVASIGSGRYRQGQLLLESIIGAAAILKQELPHCFRIFAGPFIPDDVWEHLTRLAHHVTNVQIKKYSPEFPGFLKQADLSISMGGYNTMMNILATRIRSLVYPYTANDDQEQQIRARRLESLGVVELLHPNLLASEILARKIAAILAKEPTKQPFDMDGAANTARILLGAVSSRRNSVNEVGG